MKIIFMGTPFFAVAALDALVKSNHNILAVVTAPDKPAGRGQKLRQSAIKEYALVKGFKILQPEKLKSQSFINELRALNADIHVVVAFRMLPDVVWNMPPFGTVNLHASILPQYRGAAPIQWAIINGEKESGVSTFFLTHDVDTGNVLFSNSAPIREDETAGELHNKLMLIGAQLLVKTIAAIESGDYHETPQGKLASLLQKPLKQAPKIRKEDCLIHWDKPVHMVYNQIRGLSPYPAAYTFLENHKLKIYKAELQKEKPNVAPGNFISDGKHFFKFACVDGYINLREVQLEGKKIMPIEEFLRGYRNIEILKN